MTLPKKPMTSCVPKEYSIKVILGNLLKPYILIAERMEISDTTIMFYKNTFELIAVFPVQFTIIDNIENLKQ